MKTTLVLLSLAVVAIGNARAALLNGPERFYLETGNIGPNDSKLTEIVATHTPVEGVTLNWMETGFSMPTAQLTIAYIQILDRKISGARAEIVSGGVGSDHVRIRFTPQENRAFDFKVDIYGDYTTFEKSGSIPEMITFEEKHTSPSQ